MLGLALNRYTHTVDRRLSTTELLRKPSKTHVQLAIPFPLAQVTQLCSLLLFLLIILSVPLSEEE